MNEKSSGGGGIGFVGLLTIVFITLMQGASLLCLHPKRYRQFEPGNCWGTVESTAEFLRQTADNCDKFPTAVIEVDC